MDCEAAEEAGIATANAKSPVQEVDSWHPCRPSTVL